MPFDPSALPSAQEWLGELQGYWQGLTPQKQRAAGLEEFPDDLMGMCYIASKRLRDKLWYEQGVQTRIVPGYAIGDASSHFWLEMPDGTYLDPTASQLSQTITPGQIAVAPPDDPRRQGEYPQSWWHPYNENIRSWYHHNPDEREFDFPFDEAAAAHTERLSRYALTPGEEEALRRKKNKFNAATMERMRSRRRQMPPEEAFQYIHRLLTEHGELNRRNLLHGTGLSSEALDAALGHGLQAGLLDMEERRNHPIGGGRIGQFWRLRPPENPPEQLSLYERRNSPVSFDYDGRPYRRGQFLPGTVMFQHTPQRPQWGVPAEYANLPYPDDQDAGWFDPEAWAAPDFGNDVQPALEPFGTPATRPQFQMPVAPQTPATRPQANFPDVPQVDMAPANLGWGQREIDEHMANLHELAGYPDPSFLESYWNSVPDDQKRAVEQRLPQPTQTAPAVQAAPGTQEPSPQTDVQAAFAPPPSYIPKPKVDMYHAQPVESKRMTSGSGAGEMIIKTFQDPDGSVWRGGFKPQRGEPNNSQVVSQGTYYLREAAASAIGDVFGLGDILPNTVIREFGEEGIGSMQHWVPDAAIAWEVGEGGEYDGDVDAARGAAFDYIMGNSDRHTGNWMLGNQSNPEHPGNLILIDHGLVLPKSHMVDRAAQPWEPRYCKLMQYAALKDLPIPMDMIAGKWPQIEQSLREHRIEPEAIELARQRYETIASGQYLTMGQLPAWWLSHGLELKRALYDPETWFAIGPR